MHDIIQNWQTIAKVVAVAVFIGLIGHFLIYHILRKLIQRTKSAIDNSLVNRCYHPLLWIIIIIVIRLSLTAAIAEEELTTLNHVISLILIGLVSWLLIKSVYVLEDFVVSRFEVGVKDNLQARKIHTQFRVLKRVVIILVGIVALATMLMTFPKVRQLGTTILASAGIIGIIVGMAAQKTISTLIAGIQIAFTQPIRVDDVVIVENEWGRIEEITLTYVVVKIWDLRRLIVPITYFIERPFQNWTRTSADILGTVFIYTDYCVPIDVIREELQRILKNSDQWDGKVCVLQVTNASDRGIELRALMSAPDASTAWNLRCEVREKLIDSIQKNYPQSLPKLRAELKQFTKKGEKGAGAS